MCPGAEGHVGLEERDPRVVHQPLHAHAEPAAAEDENTGRVGTVEQELQERLDIRAGADVPIQRGEEPANRAAQAGLPGAIEERVPLAPEVLDAENGAVLVDQDRMPSTIG